MVEEKIVDFLVVGAGMAGASAAANLAARGSVVLLDMESQPGYHTTGRSAALYSEMYGNNVIRSLTRASRNFFFEPSADFASTALVTRRPTVFFARSDQLGSLERFRASPDIHQATSVLSADDVQKRIPILKPGYVAGGLIEEGSADIDVDALHQGFLRQARQRNARLVLESAVKSLSYQCGLWTVHTLLESFRARVVVNAAGAWGDEIAALAGVPTVGLQPLRRTALLIPVPGGIVASDWPAAIDIDEQFYFKPDAGLLLLSPADEQPSLPCDAQPEELDVAIAVDRFEQATGTEVRQVRHRWAGLRVFAPDRSPVVGFDHIVPGFFWLVGQGGYGIQTAPALGRLAAALVCNEPVPSDIAACGVTSEMLSRARFN